MKALCARLGIDPFTVLLAAVKVLLMRYSEEIRRPGGSVALDRSGGVQGRHAEYLANPAALRIDLSDDPTAVELMHRVAAAIRKAVTIRDNPCESTTPSSSQDFGPAVPKALRVMFVYFNFSASSSIEIGTDSDPTGIDDDILAGGDLILIASKNDGPLALHCEFDTDLFPSSTILRMVAQLRVVIEAMLSTPKRRVPALPILPEAERHQLLVEWNATATSVPREACVHRWFEVRVERAPDRAAVVFQDQWLSYRELDRRANRLAHCLQGLGVGPEVRVGLFLERSLDLVVGILGILKAGGAYVPLDPDYPRERVAFMLQDARAPVVITDRRWADRLSETGVRWVCPDTDGEATPQNALSPGSDVTAANLACVIYTSGSSGTPKGVLVIHRGLGNLSAAQIEAFAVDSHSRQLLFASASFDASISEILMALHAGALLCVATREVLLPGKALVELLRERAITHVTLPPSALSALPGARLPALEAVISAGEACPVDCVERWSVGRRFYNAYGPTEATVCCSTAECKGSQAPIGRPIANTRIYLLDAHGQPVPTGCAGELVIDGVGVARGYHDRPALTAERYVPDPFACEGGSRLYRTGDLARYLPDGNLEFLGRIDQQLKVRGFRIEPGEIESVLRTHPAVREALVVAHGERPGERELVGYVVADPHQASEKTGADLQARHISHWQTFYDETYRQSAGDQDPAFNFTGWNSSYTGRPIPAEEMRECVDATVERILAWHPSGAPPHAPSPGRILEIGCGTGLLLFRLAPFCRHYCATDFSQSALDYVRKHVEKQHLDRVTLRKQMADDFAGLAAESFDAVILNSVAQYFPDIDYLVRVLEGAVRVVVPGGRILVCDVRNLRLLEAYHASVQLYRASASLSQQEWRRRVQRQQAQEKELVIAPAFFDALRQHLPQIRHVGMQLKRGRHPNEITRFRYDVMLVIGGATPAPFDHTPLDWQEQNLTLSEVRRVLAATANDVVRLVRLPNARVLSAVKAAEWLNCDDHPETVSKLRQAIHRKTGIEPEDLWELSDEFPFSVEITWAGCGAPDCFDVVFRRRGVAGPTVAGTIGVDAGEREGRVISWEPYANSPLKGLFARKLVPELHGFLQQKLPAYMVPSALVLVDALPLLPNGKIDRQALPAPDRTRPELGETFVAPRTRVEAVLVAIWAEVLNLEQVGIHDDFFELGGHSLLATQVISRLQRALPVELPLGSLFSSPTVARLAESVEEAMAAGAAAKAPAIERVPRDRPLPLSFAQQRLWFLYQFQPTSAFYNEPIAVRLAGRLEVSALKTALDQIIRRHEALRTTFPDVEGRPVQAIAPALACRMERVELKGLRTRDREARARALASEHARRRFDLARGPLLRVMLLALGDEDHLLVVTMHHIVCDGWSGGIFLAELSALYRAFCARQPAPLAELPVHYADFSHWQRRWLQGEVLRKQLDYWTTQLAGPLPVLRLPCDRPRPALETHRGTFEMLSFSPTLSQGLEALSRRRNVTLFMTLFSAFLTLLHRLCDQNEMVVGTPIANRNRPEIEGLIGFFANTLVLRTDLGGDPSFRELLERVRETTLAAFAHQDLPFEELVAELKPERESSTPLVQVIFALQNTAPGRLSLPGIEARAVKVDTGTAKFELTLSLEQSDQGLGGVLEYATDRFDAATVRRFRTHYRNLLAGIVAGAQQRLSELELLSVAERHQLVTEWNATGRAYPRNRCIHQRFELQVERFPEALAVVAGERQLTYAELNRRANRLAHTLRELGAGPDLTVGVCLERSAELVVGILGILKAGAAYLPLDPGDPQERLAFMLRDTRTPLVVTRSCWARRLGGAATKVICLDRDGDRIAQHPATNPAPVAAAANLAQVMYTSGSTGDPKGISVPHRAVSRLVVNTDYVALSAAEVFLLLAPISFDASTFELWGALLHGARLVVAPDGLPSLAELAETIERHRITTLWLTAALFHQMVEEKLSGLRAVRQLLAGGDVLSVPHVRKALAALAPCRLIDGYGPTEGTTFSCCYPMTQPRQAGDSVAIGRPIANTEVYVLDRHLRPVAIGAEGELCIAGDGLARGYHHRPRLTAEGFIPNPRSEEPGSRLYRTGDRARYLADGNLAYLGRRDHQVKVRGFRIELGEIEAVLGRHPRVREAVVTVSEAKGGEKQLVAHVVPEPGAGPVVGNLSDFLKQRLPAYMVPTAFVVVDSFPATPSGKVDRAALARSAARRGVLPARSATATAFVAPRNPVEEVLAEIWSQVLPLERVGVRDNFFELGGHSLLATQVISRIANTLRVELPLRMLFSSPTVEQLAVRVATAMTGAATLGQLPVERAPARREIPLSFAQQRLWFLDQLEAESVYNIPLALRLRGQIEVGALNAALDEIGRRHESLRTTFPKVGGQPIQVISAPPPLVLAVVDLRRLPGETREAEAHRLASADARRRMDLARGPLWRTALLELGDEDTFFLVTMHHIVSDGWSMGIFLRELTALYRALSGNEPWPLAELPVQYADYSHWQRRWLAGGVLREQLAYWKAKLARPHPVLRLPTDRPRPPILRHRGKHARRELSPTLNETLRVVSRRHEVTPFMTLLAVFQTLLHRLTGQDDLIVGSPIANRNRSEIEGLIGFFVNTLALRTQLGGDPSVRELLRRVREVALEAYAHQDVPFEKLVEELQPERRAGGTPLCQVMLAFQNAPPGELLLPGVGTSFVEVDTGTAMYELALSLQEVAGTLVGLWEYPTDLFDATTIRRLHAHFQELLKEFSATDSGRRISELRLLPEVERHQLLVEWNMTAAALPRGSIDQRFEAQVERTPDAVAVVAGDAWLTYAELNRRANRLAHYLLGMGAGPEVRVGICLERSPQLLIGILATLKAGGAYVPLDANHPRERLVFMLRQTAAPMVVTETRLVRQLREGAARLVCLDAEEKPIARYRCDNPATTAGKLACVLFTSGSTGSAKGVMVAHRGLLNLLADFAARKSLGGDDHCGWWTSANFDVSCYEIFSALLCGASLHIVPEPLRGAPPGYVDWLCSRRITGAYVPPFALSELAERVERSPESWTLRRLLVGVEPIRETLLARIKARIPGVELINGYGPTETTVCSTLYSVPSVCRHERNAPIGRPVRNTRIYLLDRSLRPVPWGVPGELCVSGVGVNRGYLHRPDLSAEHFLPDPHRRELGARLYRTGDLARYGPDGNLEFLGRIDHQIKIRGFRIEPEEIEAVLGLHPRLRDVVVMAREDASGKKRLVAYVSPGRGQAPAVDELRRHVRQKLPDYMVPSAFVVLDAIPRTLTGKVDRRALPAPPKARPMLQKPFVAPRNAVEETLAGILSQLLEIERVGVHDNFFEIGGHSLLATQVIARIAETLQVELPLLSLFEAPTVAALAKQVTAAPKRVNATPE